MKKIIITLRDAIMIVSAISASTYLQIAPIIKTVETAISLMPLINLEGEIECSFSIDQLSFIYSILSYCAEGTYAKVNSRLLDQLITIATDTDIAQFLTERSTERDASIATIVKRGSKYLNGLPANLFSGE